MLPPNPLPITSASENERSMDVTSVRVWPVP